MPDLMHLLQGRDLGFMRIVALLWGIELTAPDAHTALPALVEAILHRELVSEVVESLPLEARTALEALLRASGRISWSEYTRRFGLLREMGPSRRDRERPYLAPVSPVEILWYRGLIGRVFLETSGEPQEFAILPDDLAPLLPRLELDQPVPLGRPASPAESAYPIPANDHILDDACTLLAGLRLGYPADRLPAVHLEIPASILVRFLSTAGLLNPEGLPLPELSRTFLEAPRAQALTSLVQTWLSSQTFNELKQLPGLLFQGEWSNDPVRTRQVLLELICQVPAGQWWSLAGFVAGVRERFPDFQRPAGDYDSWFIRAQASGEYLRGFVHWDAVDGALVRYLICGPLHWLGVLDLAAPGEKDLPTAFRHSAWSASLLEGNIPSGLSQENAQLILKTRGLVYAPRLTPRSVRYQVARFCRWEGEGKEGYAYRITPAALEKARNQGLRLNHLLNVLRKHAGGPLPISLQQALTRWDNQGTQARLEKVTVLRVKSPAMLEALRNSKAGRFTGDLLGPTAVTIIPGAEEKVQLALLELGYLTDDARIEETNHQESTGG